MRCALLLVFVASALALPLTPGHHGLHADLDPATMSFNVSVDGHLWFTGGGAEVTFNGHTYSSLDGTLKNLEHSSSKGADAWGPYDATTVSWGVDGTDGAVFATTFRVYENTVAFQQTFPTQLSGTATGNKDGCSSRFPMFQMFDPATPRGILAYNKDMVGDSPVFAQFLGNLTSLPGGVAGTAPVVVFNKDLSGSFVLSPASAFMAVNQEYDADHHTLSYGVMGNATSVPAGFSLETVAHYSFGGVNEAMRSWGYIMRSRYGKEANPRDRDVTLRYLGYSTDNGAYYYYYTEEGKNYEDTLIDVRKYADKEGIPYRYILLDSWWYYKGVGDGVKNWTAMPSIFPHGLDYLRNQTGWPVQGHNRYWSADTSYAKQNGGDFDFIIQGNYAVPTEQRFWDYLLSSSSQWGLVVYEQDWLDNEYDNLPALTNDVELARTWLRQMGQAASDNGMAIQYCMSHCRHMLQSLEIPSVTQARSSGDYSQSASDQWNIGTTSIFADALGIAPSKDNYWSERNESGNPRYKGRAGEPWSRLQAAVLSLSTGPVAPSDENGKSNPQLINKACMTDGTLLSPQHPAKAIDEYFVAKSFGSDGPDGEVWTATSFMLGGRYVNVLSVDLTTAYPLDHRHLGDGPVVVYEANSTATPTLITQDQPLKLSPSDKYSFESWSVSPVAANGWALLGEQSKWVPVSPARFVSLDVDGKTMTVQLNGVEGETTGIAFRAPDGSVVEIPCTFGPAGSATVTVPAKECIAH